MCSVGEIVKRMKEEDYDMEEKHEKATLSHVQQNLEALKHTNIVHVQQNLEANTLYKKDREYMIKDGEVF